MWRPLANTTNAGPPNFRAPAFEQQWWRWGQNRTPNLLPRKVHRRAPDRNCSSSAYRSVHGGPPTCGGAVVRTVVKVSTCPPTRGNFTDGVYAHICLSHRLLRDSDTLLGRTALAEVGRVLLYDGSANASLLGHVHSRGEWQHRRTNTDCRTDERLSAGSHASGCVSSRRRSWCNKGNGAARLHDPGDQAHAPAPEVLTSSRATIAATRGACPSRSTSYNAHAARNRTAGITASASRAVDNRASAPTTATFSSALARAEVWLDHQAAMPTAKRIAAARSEARWLPYTTCARKSPTTRKADGMSDSSRVGS